MKRAWFLSLVVGLGGMVLTAAEPPTKAKSAAAEKPKVMETFVVTEESTLSFGLSLKILRYNATKQVAAIYIEDIDPTSDAAAQELRPGMQVLAIEGKPAGDYEATFKTGSELRRLLIGRKREATITVEIDPLDGSKPRTLTLHNFGIARTTWKQSEPRQMMSRILDDPLQSTPIFRK